MHAGYKASRQPRAVRRFQPNLGAYALSEGARAGSCLHTTDYINYVLTRVLGRTCIMNMIHTETTTYYLCAISQRGKVEAKGDTSH